MRIKEMRNELNLTQIELAKAINTSQRNVGRWENEENEPTSSFLIALADFFQCSVDYLLGRSDDFGNVTVSGVAGEQLLDEEKELLRIYRSIDSELQHRALGYMRRLFDVGKDEAGVQRERRSQ